MAWSACRLAARTTVRLRTGPSVSGAPVQLPRAHFATRSLSLNVTRPQHNQVQPTPSPFVRFNSSTAPSRPKHDGSSSAHTSSRTKRLAKLLAVVIALTALYNFYPPFRHSTLAIVRCSRLMTAVLQDVWDYKRTFAKESKLCDTEGNPLEGNKEVIRQARKACHTRSAERILKALKKNSGIYVKIGQHVAAVQVLPKEWTSTLTPLQDQCTPTPVEDIDAMLRTDLGLGIDDLFIDFDPKPIGVASLAQVHRAVDRKTGQPVAVKVQHADLQEFAQVDLATVNFAISFVKMVFPEFEFGWLGEEMNEMLPQETNFRHEAANSLHCRRNFEPLSGKTSLYLPQVLWAERRCLVMEFINGARIDDLAYLKEHNIDRNQVSQELSRIFSKMVYLDGFFHADPHHGNLLVRPRSKDSTSPFNFDVCLLDHGQYFDIPSDLRVNYARFWLSLMTPNSEETSKERKKYARLVGNIDDDMVSQKQEWLFSDKQYPFLESAITGRVSMEEGHHRGEEGQGPRSLLEGAESGSKEVAKLRAAAMDTEGLLAGIFQMLRTVPR